MLYSYFNVSLCQQYVKKINLKVILIPVHEQQYVFEPFYRGENKKLKIRGLESPFSKMLAKAQKGDLVLKESNEQGTTFTIIVEKSN
ncbi:ATP-binding protein [Peribacillus sp. TH14]|uniref:ATP-binding protein n=1 Tax=Peribacillus sp. TH14 TaxID=2798481 RepID=UPI001A91E190|nr:ATP-binding protein [Peribacillus sp. TH14]